MNSKQDESLTAWAGRDPGDAWGPSRRTGAQNRAQAHPQGDS